jgi:hypothetical protein
MYIFKNKWAYFVIFIVISTVFIGCKNRNELIKCEEFNLNLIKYDIYYFDKKLYYTNNIDTVILDCVDCEISKFYEYERGGGFVGQCIPEFFVSYFDKAHRINLQFGFQYLPLEKSKKLKLNLGVNSSTRELDLDTLNFEKKTIIIMGNKYKLGNEDEPETIKKIEIKDYRIISIEKESGENWKLLKVENSRNDQN